MVEADVGDSFDVGQKAENLLVDKFNHFDDNQQCYSPKMNRHDSDFVFVSAHLSSILRFFGLSLWPLAFCPDNTKTIGTRFFNFLVPASSSEPNHPFHTVIEEGIE